MVKGRPTLVLLRQARALDEGAAAELQAVPAARAVLSAPIDRRTRGLDRPARLELAAEAGRLARQDLGQAPALLLQARGLRWRVVLLNEGLARQLVGSGDRGLYERSDLLQVARLGLFEATKRFDPDRGVQFSVYARWWMRGALIREAPECELASATREKLSTLRRFEARAITGESTLAELLGMTAEALAELRALARTQEQRSMDASLGEDERGTLHDVLHEEEDDERPEGFDGELARRLVARLPEREARILSLRFGLGGEEPMSRPEIGRRVKVSAQRIAQLERGALQKLREQLAEPGAG